MADFPNDEGILLPEVVADPKGAEAVEDVKEKRITINWKSRNGVEISKDIFRNIVSSEPWAQKNQGAAFGTAANLTNLRIPNLLGGAKLTSQTFKKVTYDAVGLFDDKFYQNPATNFSGKNVDRDDPNNYDDLELLIKPVHAAMKGIKDKKEETLKEKEASLVKDKKNLEQSALSLHNKNQKSVNTGEGKPMIKNSCPVHLCLCTGSSIIFGPRRSIPSAVYKRCN
jgi:hypothetical protein